MHAGVAQIEKVQKVESDHWMATHVCPVRTDRSKRPVRVARAARITRRALCLPAPFLPKLAPCTPPVCAIARSRPHGFAPGRRAVRLPRQPWRAASTTPPAHVELKIYVSSVSDCFWGMSLVFHIDIAMAIHVSFKTFFKMFQLFHTCVASILRRCCICCSCMFQMFHLFHNCFNRVLQIQI